MITLENVSVIFNERGIQGLHDLNLKINPGDNLCLMGPNGAGKSTLLNLVAQKVSPTKGKISLTNKVSFVPQIIDDSISVKEFLCSKSDAEGQEKKIQLARDMAMLFEIERELEMRIGTLSQGLKERVLIGASLINFPEVLILDEPFTHLDLNDRNQLMGKVCEICQEKEIILLWATHERDLAFQFAHTLAVINFGKIEQLGSPKELYFSPQSIFIAKFMGHQNIMTCQILGKNIKTVFGEHPAPDTSSAAIVGVFPSECFEINPSAPHKGHIKNVVFKDGYFEYLIGFNHIDLKVKSIKRLSEFNFSIDPSKIIYVDCL